MFWRRQVVPSMTYLSPTSEFQGNLNVDGNLRVDGIIHGNVQVLGDIEISQEGLIEGSTLRGNTIVVHGRVKAQVIAERSLILRPTAHLEGDITAQSLVVDEGAFYNGYISITKDGSTALPGVNPLPELAGRIED